jgi:hypothetical protein
MPTANSIRYPDFRQEAQGVTPAAPLLSAPQPHVLTLAATAITIRSIVGGLFLDNIFVIMESNGI